MKSESQEQNAAVFVCALVYSFYAVVECESIECERGETFYTVWYLALNNQSCEEGRALCALGLLGCLSGPGFTAVVLLIRPQAPLAFLQRLSLLCGVVSCALTPLLSVGRSVLSVSQWGSNPGVGVPGLPSQTCDISLQEATLNDAVRLLEGGGGDTREIDVRQEHVQVEMEVDFSIDESQDSELILIKCSLSRKKYQKFN